MSGFGSLLAGFSALAERHGNASYPIADPRPPMRTDITITKPAVSRPEDERVGIAFCEMENCFALPIFAKDRSCMPPLGRDVIRALLPPPSQQKEYNKWLNGAAPNHLSVGIALDEINDDLADELLQIEVLVSRVPGGDLPYVRSPCDAWRSQPDADWLYSITQSEGTGNETSRQDLHRPVMAYTSAIAAVLRKFEPNAVTALSFHNAHLKIGLELAGLLLKVQKLEDAWLKDGPAGDGGIHDVRGAISCAADLLKPSVFMRAAFLHVMVSVPIATALRDAVVEYRFAQVLAVAPPDNWIMPSDVEALLPSAAGNETVNGMLGRLIARYLQPKADPPSDCKDKPEPEFLFKSFQERAAIIEYDAVVSRAKAEKLALKQMAANHGLEAANIIRAWSLVAEINPQLSSLTFRTSP